MPYRCITQNTTNDMSDLEELRKAIVQFTQERDWDQFHNGKDLALALSIEASELNEGTVRCRICMAPVASE